jgi:hypothetical protein
MAAQLSEVISMAINSAAGALITDAVNRCVMSIPIPA